MNVPKQWYLVLYFILSLALSWHPRSWKTQKRSKKTLQVSIFKVLNNRKIHCKFTRILSKKDQISVESLNLVETSISVEFAPLPTNQHHLPICFKSFCIYIVVIQRFTFLGSLKLKVHEKLPSKFEKKTHMVYNIYISSQTLRRARPLAWLFLCRILSSLSGFSWIGSMAEKYSYSCLVQWPAVRTCSQI